MEALSIAWNVAAVLVFCPAAPFSIALFQVFSSACDNVVGKNASWSGWFGSEHLRQTLLI